MQTQEDHSNPIPALNVDSLKVDLVVIQNTCSEKEDNNSETASNKLKFIDSKFTLDYDSQMTDTYFVEYIGLEVQHFRDTLLQHLGNVKKSVAERTRHQRQYERRVNKRQIQTQESKIDTWSGNDTDAVDARYQDHYDEEQWMRVDQYPKQCQVKSPMLDSSPGWIPTGKLSDSCTSKVDSEPPHGSM
ncbi:hypothetical protein Tco_0814645 [Tanacetum coccineum]